jgi:hypothetical protein
MDDYRNKINSYLNKNKGLLDSINEYKDNNTMLQLREDAYENMGVLISSGFSFGSSGLIQPDLFQSTIQVSNSLIQIGFTSLITLTVRAANGIVFNSGGFSVIFSKSGSGTSEGTFSPVIDNSNGTYTSIFTGTVSGSQLIVSASINGSQITSLLPTITVNPATPSLINSTITLSQSNIISGGTSLVTLTVRDSNNVPLQNFSVIVFLIIGGSSNGTLSPTISLGNGIYNSTITGTISGTASQVTATINGSLITSTLPSFTVTSGSTSLLNTTKTVSLSTIVSGAISVVTLIERDSSGNQATSGGKTVIFSLTGGGTSSGTFSTVIDNNNGTYTSNFTGTTSGTLNNIQAIIDGNLTTSTNPSITVQVGALSLSSSIKTVSLSSIVSGSTSLVTVTTRDLNGNQLTTGGRIIVLSLTGVGTSSGTFSSVTDNNNGTYISTFTGTASGTPKSIQVAIDGNLTTSPNPTITVTTGTFSLLNSTKTLSLSSIVSGTVSIVTLIVKDLSNNQLSSGGLTVLFSQIGSGTSSGTFSPVIDNNNGTYSSNFTGIVSGSFIDIQATINGSLVVSPNPSITVTTGTFSLSNSNKILSLSSISVGQTSVVTLFSKDLNANNITSGGLTVTFSTIGGTSTVSFNSTIDLGNGTYTSIITGVSSGTNINITASINGQITTSPHPTLSITLPPASINTSTIAISSGSVISGNTVTITMTTRNASNVLLASGGLTVTFSTIGTVNSTFSFGPTIDLNDGTYTSVITGLIPGGISHIIGYIGGVQITTVSVGLTVNNTALSYSLSTTTLSISNTFFGYITTVTLQARDTLGNPMIGAQTVVFSKNATGTSNGTFSSIITNNIAGTHTATLTATTTGTTTTIRTNLNGTFITSTEPSWTVLAQSPSILNCTFASDITAQTIANNAIGYFNAIATIKDASGNLILSPQTVTVSLSSGLFLNGTVTNNGDGTYSQNIYGNSSTGNKNINGAVNGISFPTFSVVMDSTSSINSTLIPSSTTMSLGNFIIITATFRTSSNLTIFGPYLVNPTVSSGTSNLGTGTISNLVTLALKNGTNTFRFTPIATGSGIVFSSNLNIGATLVSTPSVTIT